MYSTLTRTATVPVTDIPFRIRYSSLKSVRKQYIIHAVRKIQYCIHELRKVPTNVDLTLQVLQMSGENSVIRIRRRRWFRWELLCKSMGEPDEYGARTLETEAGPLRQRKISSNITAIDWVMEKIAIGDLEVRMWNESWELSLKSAFSSRNGRDWNESLHSRIWDRWKSLRNEEIGRHEISKPLDRRFPIKTEYPGSPTEQMSKERSALFASESVVLSSESQKINKSRGILEDEKDARNWGGNTEEKRLVDPSSTYPLHLLPSRQIRGYEGRRGEGGVKGEESEEEGWTRTHPFVSLPLIPAMMTESFFFE